MEALRVEPRVSNHSALAEEFRFKRMVNTVIQPGRIDHARDLLDFANDTGIWYCPVPLNVGRAVHGELREDAAYHALVDTILYIQVGELHRCHLGWIAGVPLWSALWWALAVLVWKDLSGRMIGRLLGAQVAPAPS